MRVQAGSPKDAWHTNAQLKSREENTTQRAIFKTTIYHLKLLKDTGT